jgi:hypothetical protein
VNWSPASATERSQTQVPWSCNSKPAFTTTILLPFNTPLLVTFSLPRTSCRYSMHGTASRSLAYVSWLRHRRREHSLCNTKIHLVTFRYRTGWLRYENLREHDLFFCRHHVGYSPSVTCLSCACTYGLGTLTGVAALIYLPFFACHEATGWRSGILLRHFPPWLRVILSFQRRHVFSKDLWR